MNSRQTEIIPVSGRYFRRTKKTPLRIETTPEVKGFLESLSHNLSQVEQVGILGMSNKTGILTHIYLDVEAQGDFASVKPKAQTINAVLERWKKEDDVKFVGMFHTHCSGLESLSKQDLAYARCILARNHMPCMLMGVITQNRMRFYAVAQQ